VLPCRRCFLEPTPHQASQPSADAVPAPSST
jgi:hypothetical protein